MGCVHVVIYIYIYISGLMCVRVCVLMRVCVWSVRQYVVVFLGSVCVCVCVCVCVWEGGV